jgi:hypothetical protein
MIGGTSLTKEQADAICELIADGASVRNICLMPDMPSRWTVMEALRNDAEFANQYARAREMQADTLAAEILEIADDGTRDMRVDDEGREIVDHDHIARSRLRVHARQWFAGKVAPKKYGDKLELASNPDNPVIPAETASSRDIARGMLLLIAKAEKEADEPA